MPQTQAERSVAKNRAAFDANAEASGQARDIGAPPTIKNPSRRLMAKKSLRYFLAEYFAARFPLAFSPYHEEAIADFERATKLGGLFALAMPRGSGKSTIIECAVLWAVLFGFRRFVCLVGAEKGHSKKACESILGELEGNEKLHADFPEATHALRALEGVANRAKGQHIEGTRTLVDVSGGVIKLPQMPKNGDGSQAIFSECEGAIILGTGITAGIRGMKYRAPDGAQLRPDFVVLDDIQTDKSANSKNQVMRRESLVNGAILGLSSPQKKIAGIALCTVIRSDDLADRLLNTEKHPEWCGRRFAMVDSWAERADLWAQYAETRARCLREKKSIVDATAFYAENRAEMDKGARVTWQERFLDDEASALQHAYNLRLRDEETFFSEYQNAPLAEYADGEAQISADTVRAHVIALPRFCAPNTASVITAGVDVQGSSLWYVVAAFSQTLTPHVLEYGIFPKQEKHYTRLRDIACDLRTLAPRGTPADEVLRLGLLSLVDKIARTEYTRANGNALDVSRILVDAGWDKSRAAINSVAQNSQHARIITPSNGWAQKIGGRAMAEAQLGAGDLRFDHGLLLLGHQGIERDDIFLQKLRCGQMPRRIKYDANYWKSHVVSRFLEPVGAATAATVFDGDATTHEMFFDHLQSEKRTRVVAKGEEMDFWQAVPNTDNHLFDALIMATVGAASLGIGGTLGSGKSIAAQTFGITSAAHVAPRNAETHGAHVTRPTVGARAPVRPLSSMLKIKPSCRA